MSLATASQAGVSTPQAGVSTPQSGVSTPQSGVSTPQAGVSTPQTGVSTPQTGVSTPQAGGTSCGFAAALPLEGLPLAAHGPDRVEPADPPKQACHSICYPNCKGKECGPDGCGGSCGVCPEGDTCFEGQCVCRPSCQGKKCGPDGCGGYCGTCDKGKSCQDGKCVCIPDCTGKECGSNGCGGRCGKCKKGRKCVANQCVCKPDCCGKACGPDGCGGSCGTCPGSHDVCQGGQCFCVPDCGEKACGSDGCGGSCGTCPGAQDVCLGGQCVCVPDCGGKVCGPDGCGGSCGTCSGNQEQCEAGQCICIPYCFEKDCGQDGCGGSCGDCEIDEKCDLGQCRTIGEKGDCEDILLCAVECTVYQECIDDCFDIASIMGQDAYDAMVECANTTCAAFPDGSAAKHLCLIQFCPGPWSDCLGGWGDRDCLWILQCLPGCAGDRPCQWSCIFSGTEDAQELYWKAQVCVSNNCSYCGNDAACIQPCVEMYCAKEILTCEACIPSCPTCQ